MEKIVARLSSNGILLGFNLVHNEGNEELSKQDLMDFVDTDIPLFYNEEKMSVNQYLGESRCFSARLANSSYNPF